MYRQKEAIANRLSVATRMELESKGAPSLFMGALLVTCGISYWSIFSHRLTQPQSPFRFQSSEYGNFYNNDGIQILLF